MPLVDYASDSDASASNPDPPDTDTDSPRPKKKLRTGTAAESESQSPPRNPGPGSGAASTPASTSTSTTSTLPPLPAAFHDLYASTVRTTTRDDPTLHQGRTRQTPHVPGTWPSHIYIEWHPPAAVHSLLTGLLSSLQDHVKESRVTSDDDGVEMEITSFLQSDLRAPLPLHISLSRPLALATVSKDAFLRDVQGAIGGDGGGGGGIAAAFGLGCSRAEWHRTAESGRSFLVLRVYSSSSSSSTSTSTFTQAAGATAGENPNPELTALLRRCNAVATRHGQPGLYQWAGEAGAGDRQLGEAFHVSIAWSFAEPTEELVAATERVFGSREAREGIGGVQIPVDGVKVKIGNVVTHVALRQPGRKAGGQGARNLLGL